MSYIYTYICIDSKCYSEILEMVDKEIIKLPTRGLVIFFFVVFQRIKYWENFI
jgi:hypothetical protein